MANLLALLSKRVALTRLYPHANALQVGLVLDCKMVLHQPELSGGLGHPLNAFYICRFGGQELCQYVFHHGSRAKKHPGEGVEPSTGFLLPQRHGCCLPRGEEPDQGLRDHGWSPACRRPACQAFQHPVLTWDMHFHG